MIKQRIVASVLPSKPQDRQELTRIVERERRTLGADGVWPDIVYPKPGDGNWTSTGHLDRLLRMAKAYRTPGQPLFQNAELRTQTLRALDFWLDRDFRNSNWWWNEIGVPQQIGEVLLLMEADLTPDQRAKGDAIMKHSPMTGAAGANAVWEAGNNVMRGLLENDPEVVARSYSRMYGELKIVGPDQEGIQADFSFHQHGRQLYSGGYGYFYGNDLARYTALAWGTRYQIPADRLSILLGYLLDGQRWMVRGEIFDYSGIGREITRKGKVAAPTSWAAGPISPVGAAYGMPNTVGMLAACFVPRREELAAFAATLNNKRGATPPTGNRSFWMSDYMTHERPSFLATVRMLSERMVNSEITNAEGRRSQHLSDGVTYLYQTGNEYRDIFSVWDWKRLPGTTCVQDTSNPFDPAQVHVRGKTSFVGGVSDGRYGAAAFDFARGALTARKSWFFADDGFVCLGAGITDSSGDSVLTSLNQCLLRGPVQIAAGPEATGKPERIDTGAQDREMVRWVWHDGVGYAFPTLTRVHIAAQAQSGRWSDSGTGSNVLETRDVFSLWLDHGARPEGGTYAYVVLPGCKPHQIAKRAAQVEVLQNTPELQAIRSRSRGLVQAAFWKTGLLEAGPEDGAVAVDQPCLLQMLRSSHRRKRQLQLSVANPENKPLSVTVTLDGTFTGPGCTPVDGTPAKTAIRLELPGGVKAGSSKVITLQAR